MTGAGGSRRVDTNSGGAVSGGGALPLGPILTALVIVFVAMAWDCLVPSGYVWQAGMVAPHSVYVRHSLEVLLPDGQVTMLPGEVVVRQGERVSHRASAVLEAMATRSETRPLPNAIGLLLVVFAAVVVTVTYLARRAPKALETPEQMKLFLVALVFSVVAVKALAVTGASAGVIILFNPLAAAAVLLSLVLGQEVGIAAAICLAPGFGIISGIAGRGAAVTYALLGGMVGALSVSPRRSQRHDIIKAGAAVGIMNASVLLAFNLLSHLPGSEARLEVIYGWSLPGFFNGIVGAIVVIGLVPMLERSFKVTTTTTMQELTSPTRPLLQRLINEAPGTYNHASNVAYLAEDAAKEVGADAALAKAAAYYHDVGKLKRPYFFTENQLGGVNYHDNLSPHLSRLIITSHTKDGVELAKKAGVPTAICDIIQQHHGTDLVSYFYHGAKQQEATKGPVHEHTFRYPGPKPQTKEAAVVMLADAVEAACRSIEKPTPTAIDKMVTKITNDRFVDGQFDECDLTKKDIERIADSLSHNLSGMYHSRISYPDEDELFQKRAERSSADGAPSPSNGGAAEANGGATNGGAANGGESVPGTPEEAARQ